MEIYYLFIIIIALVLLFILAANSYCIYQAFVENTRKGLAFLLGFLLGYALYLFFKLIETELQGVMAENAARYFSQWTGRLLLALFCLLLGWLVGHIYLNRLFAQGNPTITAFLILFLTLVHSALVDAFFHLIDSKAYTFRGILPSFAFAVALGFYFIWRLSGESSTNRLKSLHDPDIKETAKPPLDLKGEVKAKGETGDHNGELF